MKPSQAILSMKSILKGSNTPYLQGKPGIGKSAIVRKLAEEFAEGREIVNSINPTKKQFGFIDFRLSLYETVDLGGLPYIDEDNQQKRAFLGNLPIGGEGILFFDEFAQAHSSVMCVCGQLLYERKIGEYVLPDGWKIVCAGNRATDRAGANKIPTQVNDRCTMLNVDENINDWISWATENDVSPDVLGFISYEPQYLCDFDPKITTPQPSPRSWVRLSDTLKTNPPKEILQLVCEGDIGETASIEFLTFLSLKNDLPNVQDICEGKDVEMIDEGGKSYALVCALVSILKSEMDNPNVANYFQNSLNYVEKLPTPEFAIFYVRSLIGAIPDLAETSTYSDFKIRNQDLEV